MLEQPEPGRTAAWRCSTPSSLQQALRWVQAREQVPPSVPMGLQQRAPGQAVGLPAALENERRPTAEQVRVRQAQPLQGPEELQVRPPMMSRIRSRLPSA